MSRLHEISVLSWSGRTSTSTKNNRTAGSNRACHKCFLGRAHRNDDSTRIRLREKLARKRATLSGLTLTLESYECSNSKAPETEVGLISCAQKLGGKKTRAKLLRYITVKCFLNILFLLSRRCTLLSSAKHWRREHYGNPYDIRSGAERHSRATRAKAA